MATYSITTTPQTVASASTSRQLFVNNGQADIVLDLGGGRIEVLNPGGPGGVGASAVFVATASVSASTRADTSSLDVSTLPADSGLAGSGTVALDDLDPSVTGTYAASFTVPAPTGVAATDQANITATRAEALAAVAAGATGIVRYPAGTYVLNATLPLLSGVRDIGVRPVTVPVNTTAGSWMVDMEWNYAGGTVLQGDGTFAAFSANTTPLGSVASDVGAATINACGVEDIGFDNFTYALQSGASNVMGVAWSSFRNLWAKNCTQWAFSFINFAHCTFGGLRSCLSQNGQYYAADMPLATFQPGNSVFLDELYNLMARDGRDNRLCRGIVFDAAGATSSMAHLEVTRVQNNAFGRTKLTVTATLTSGSTSIGVPDGTKWAAGMVASFTTTANGFTLTRAYVVKSVSSNTITLANSRTAAAVSATGTGSMTLETYGHPNIEVTSSSATSNIVTSEFSGIDSEGAAGAGLYIENASLTKFALRTCPTASQQLVVRTTTNSEFTSREPITADIDGGSADSHYYGARNNQTQRGGSGIWYDSSLGSGVLGINGASFARGGDAYRRAGFFIYPTTGWGERIQQWDTTATFDGTNCGDIIFNGAAGQTVTLPTIVTDSSTPASSHLGMWCDFINVSANSLTVATGGGQLFNNVGGKTGLTVASQTGLRVVACKTSSGTLFWAARAYSLA